MKRLVFLVVALVAAVSAASAMAAPAPKATGGIGYSDANRSFAFKFDAIQSSDKPITVWNVEGVTSFDFQLDGDTTNGHYVHNAALTQTGQSVTGTGSHGAGNPWANTWQVTAGTVVGNNLDLTWAYLTGPEDVPGLTHHMTGTIAADGTISGTWNDLYQGVARTGTFTATGATSTTYAAKGLAFYSDANDYYVMAVRAVSVGTGADVGKAWFAGEVVDTNRADWMGDWVSFKVKDNGQGGTALTTDKLWGAFADSPAAALATVTGKSIPSTNGIDSAEYSITSGNLQVH